MEQRSVSSNVDARLGAISNDLDLSEAPPIHQKRLVTFFNHFIITMVDFLNRFSNSCSHRLFMFDRKISKIEAELRLLEIKLKSIPGFEDEKPPTPTLAVKEAKPVDQVPSETSNVNQKPANLESEEPKEPEPPAEIDPAILKYSKMVRVGVPVPAVKLKMQAEGLDPELLRM